MYHYTRHHDYNKRIGIYKITYILGYDDDIFISTPSDTFYATFTCVPRNLKSNSCLKESSSCYTDHPHQDFSQKAPNLIWTSKFTYPKTRDKWYYLLMVHSDKES